jgi:four helix bundle protein
MAESIEQLHIYKTARSLEDQVYELVKTLPTEQFYGLGNNLRRATAAVSHHIAGAHRLFSYRLKVDELAAMRREAEAAQYYLESITDTTTGKELISGYTSVIKQSWGLTKWLNSRIQEKQQKAEITAKDELIAAR